VHHIGKMRPEREADYSPPSSVKVKNSGAIPQFPPIRIHGVVFN
jgi:hypothetical protein